MLLREEGDGSVLAIGQPAHAWVSGQLARAWGNAAFGEVSPREPVCLAAEQHDIGMALYDLAPRLDPATGLPFPFDRMPFPLHLELWEAAPRRVLAQSRYAALLVSMHGVALYGLRDLAGLPAEEAARIRAYLEAERALQARLIAGLGAPAAEVARNQRLVWTWDSLSLGLCLGWPPRSFPGAPAAEGEVELRVEPVGGASGRFTVAPWPFSESAVTIWTEGRRLRGPYADEAALHAALAGAPGETLTFELVPG